MKFTTILRTSAFTAAVFSTATTAAPVARSESATEAIARRDPIDIGATPVARYVFEDVEDLAARDIDDEIADTLVKAIVARALTPTSARSLTADSPAPLPPPQRRVPRDEDSETADEVISALLTRAEHAVFARSLTEMERRGLGTVLKKAWEVIREKVTGKPPKYSPGPLAPPYTEVELPPPYRPRDVQGDLDEEAADEIVKAIIARDAPEILGRSLTEMERRGLGTVLKKAWEVIREKVTGKPPKYSPGPLAPPYTEVELPPPYRP